MPLQKAAESNGWEGQFTTPAQAGDYALEVLAADGTANPPRDAGTFLGSQAGSGASAVRKLMWPYCSGWQPPPGAIRPTCRVSAGPCLAARTIPAVGNDLGSEATPLGPLAVAGADLRLVGTEWYLRRRWGLV